MKAIFLILFFVSVNVCAGDAEKAEKYRVLLASVDAVRKSASLPGVKSDTEIVKPAPVPILPPKKPEKKPVTPLIDTIIKSEKVSIHLDDVPLIQAIKFIYDEVARRPYILTTNVDVAAPVTISLKDVLPHEAVQHLEALLKTAGYAVEQHAGVAFVDRAQPSENETLIYRPKYRSSKYLTDVIQSVTSARSLMTRSYPSSTTSTSEKPVDSGNRSEKKQVSPTSVEGQTDKTEVDQIAFSVKPQDLAKVKKLLADLDTPTGELLVRAAIYEVGTTKIDGGAVNLAFKVAGLSLGLGSIISNASSFKLALGGIEAVLSALDGDSRFRSLSKPYVRVKNGSMARFSVGSDVPVLGSVQMDRAGNSVQSIEYRPSGIILTAKPEIRDGVVDLDLSQELSSFVATATGVNTSPTLIKRALQSRFQLQPGEVVILAGLEENKEEGQVDRLPFVGWETGKQDQNKKSEILILVEVSRL